MSEISSDETINHEDDLVKDLVGLHQNKKATDVTFIIENERIPAHRCILAARCSYFCGLLFGGFAEATKHEIELDVNLPAFKILMEYIYVGSISVSKYDDNLLIDTIDLASEYDCRKLVSCLIEILCKRVTLDNVFVVTKAVQLHGSHSNEKLCFDFIDANANYLLDHESFKTLSKELLSQIIQRDSFSVEEVDIFKSILVWSRDQPTADTALVLQHVRFTLMQIEELKSIVKPSNFLTAAKIESIINEIKSRDDLPFRCGTKHRLQIEMYGYCMKSDRHDSEILFNKPLLFKLSEEQHISHIEIMNCAGYFSYYIEVSTNLKEWTRIVDYSQYICHSNQTLYVNPIYTKYIYIKPVSRSNSEIGCSVRLLFKNAMPKMVNDIISPLHEFCEMANVERHSYTIHLPQPFYVNYLYARHGGAAIRLTSIETSLNGKNFKKLERFENIHKIVYSFKAHVAGILKIDFPIEKELPKPISIYLGFDHTT